MHRLRRVIRRLVREVELNIEKEKVDGWLVERMPGYVSVDDGDQIFIEVDDRGMFVHIGDKSVFVPASVAGNLEQRWI